MQVTLRLFPLFSVKLKAKAWIKDEGQRKCAGFELEKSKAIGA